MRSPEVIFGQKISNEGQISIFFKSRQTIPQNEVYWSGVTTHVMIKNFYSTFSNEYKDNSA